MNRIGLDYRPALFSRTGIARAVRELARAMAVEAPRRNCRLALFGHGFKRPLDDAPRPTALRRSRIPGRALPALAALGLDAARLVGGADLFHWTDYVYPPVSRRRVRVVQTVHDLAFLEDERFHGDETPKLADRFRAAVARADLLICPSQATRSAIARLVPGATNVAVIPFGVDHVPNADAERGRRLAADRLGSNARYMITVGTFEPRKNHDALLDSLCLLAAAGRPVPLVCVGAAGWQTEAVTARIAGRGLPFPCVHSGEVGDREMFDLVAGAALLAYPSSLEGFGFPPLEALELGVPVLVGSCAALHEHVGDAGVFVAGRDPRDIAHGIERLLDDRELVAAKLHAWRERRSRFRWQDTARRHLDAYSAVLDSRTEAAP